MLLLTSRGFSCVGLDSSPALAELARRHTGLPVIEADFESFDFQAMDMDALLLVGALVHVPHERFKALIRSMTGGWEYSKKIFRGCGVRLDKLSLDSFFNA